MVLVFGTRILGIIYWGRVFRLEDIEWFLFYNEGYYFILFFVVRKIKYNFIEKMVLEFVRI